MKASIDSEWLWQTYGHAGLPLLEVLAKHKRGPTLRYLKLLNMYFVVESFAASNRPKMDPKNG